METQASTEEIKIPSQQLLDGIFNLSISAVKQIVDERQVHLPEAKEAVAKYLERIVDGLRYEN